MYFLNREIDVEAKMIFHLNRKRRTRIDAVHHSRIIPGVAVEEILRGTTLHR
jgi:hypothetical protein